MRERFNTLLSWEVIELIKDVFYEDELNNFNNYIDKNNDKEKAEGLKSDMIKLLKYLIIYQYLYIWIHHLLFIF